MVRLVEITIHLVDGGLWQRSWYFSVIFIRFDKIWTVKSGGEYKDE